jgi:hypothetical protein
MSVKLQTAAIILKHATTFLGVSIVLVSKGMKRIGEEQVAVLK